MILIFIRVLLTILVSLVFLLILRLLVVHHVDILEFLLELDLGNVLRLSKSLSLVAKPLLLHTEVFDLLCRLLFGAIFFRET